MESHRMTNYGPYQEFRDVSDKVKDGRGWDTPSLIIKKLKCIVFWHQVSSMTRPVTSVLLTDSILFYYCPFIRFLL